MAEVQTEITRRLARKDAYEYEMVPKEPKSKDHARDPTGDWGDDLLAHHYARPHGQSHFGGYP